MVLKTLSFTSTSVDFECQIIFTRALKATYSVCRVMKASRPWPALSYTLLLLFTTIPTHARTFRHLYQGPLYATSQSRFDSLKDAQFLDYPVHVHKPFLEHWLQLYNTHSEEPHDLTTDNEKVILEAEELGGFPWNENSLEVPQFDIDGLPYEHQDENLRFESVDKEEPISRPDQMKLTNGWLVFGEDLQAPERRKAFPWTNSLAYLKNRDLFLGDTGPLSQYWKERPQSVSVDPSTLDPSSKQRLGMLLRALGIRTRTGDPADSSSRENDGERAKRPLGILRCNGWGPGCSGSGGTANKVRGAQHSDLR